MSVLECVAKEMASQGRMWLVGTHRGYTWFGEVLYGLLRSRGSSQSSFARGARELGYDYRQNSVSNWMRGVHAAPRELPGLLDRMYGLNGGEWLEVGVSFAYGQSASQEDLEDVGEFRRFYRELLEAEKEYGARAARKRSG